MTNTDFSCLADAPQSHDLADLTWLKTALRGLGYTYDGVKDLLGPRAFEALGRDQILPGLYRVEQVLGQADADQQLPGQAFSQTQQSLARLIAFFLLGQSLPAQELDLALGQGASSRLERLGLAGPAPEGSAPEGPAPEGSGPQNPSPAGPWQALVDLRPYSADDGLEIYVASDLGAHQRPGVLPKDHVLGIGRASLTLAQFIERTPLDRALDLGCGCGIQVFHLLAHVRQVTATDISARALAFTRFNLLLNAQQLGLDPHNLEERVTLAQGSLLEPVAGQLFDLVVSNPPFVITPRQKEERAEDQFTYRDAGLPGDSLIASLVRDLPGILKPGGRAQMLGNWEIQQTQGPEAGWQQRPQSWLADQTEAWFIQREQVSPEEYAETWLQDASENRDPEHYQQAYRAYLQDFASRGVESIGFGMIWLRRPADPQASGLLRRFEEITYPLGQPLAPALTAALAHYDWVNSLTDQQLMDLHLVPAEDVTEERHFTPGSEHPSVILLRAGAGLRRTILESSETAGFVSACDGQLSVGQILGALAALLDWQSPEPQQQLVSNIRELLDKGFLVPDQAD